MENPLSPVKLALLASGEGTNIQAIIDSCRDGCLTDIAIPALIISNRKDSGTMRRAENEHIPSYYINCKGLNLDEADIELLEVLRQHGIDFVIASGALWKFGKRTIKQYSGKFLNIHPADPKKFGGKSMFGIVVHRAVLASGETITTPTVHQIDEEYDHGEIVWFETVPVIKGDTSDLLAGRVLAVEHQIYPKAIRKVILERRK